MKLFSVPWDPKGFEAFTIHRVQKLGKALASAPGGEFSTKSGGEFSTKSGGETLAPSSASHARHPPPPPARPLNLRGHLSWPVGFPDGATHVLLTEARVQNATLSWVQPRGTSSLENAVSATVIK